MAEVTLGRTTAMSRTSWKGHTDNDVNSLLVHTLYELQGSGEEFELTLVVNDGDASLEPTPEVRTKESFAKWQQRQLSGIRSHLNRYARRFDYQVANSTPYVAKVQNGEKVGLDLVTVIFEPKQKDAATTVTKSGQELADEFISNILATMPADEEEETA